MLKFPIYGFARRVDDTVARAMAILRDRPDYTLHPALRTPPGDRAGPVASMAMAKPAGPPRKAGVRAPGTNSSARASPVPDFDSSNRRRLTNG
jgi:hypothetical protein